MDVLDDFWRELTAAIYPNRVLIGLIGAGVLVVLASLAWRRRWDRQMRRHPKSTIAGAAVVLAVAVPLGWYLASPLFISSTIDEPAPVVAAEPTVAPSPSAPAAPTATAAPSPAASATPSPTLVALIDRVGSFTGTDEFHFGMGTARLIETSPGAFTVRLEDFAVRNGPDLYVYLSPSADGYADGAIELGRLKADRGNQNYEVPDGVDVSGAASVIIWCKQFSHLFATAPLGT